MLAMTQQHTCASQPVTTRRAFLTGRRVPGHAAGTMRQMSTREPRNADQIERLREWREGPGRDTSMKFVGDWFKRQVAKPHEQVAQFSEVWRQLVPSHLQDKTALASLARGVLTVHVADSGTMYELDRLMRTGLERQIKTTAKASLRKIKLKVASLG
ncbi:MAG: DUF721 domain-containing protein [Phycisphaera sp.]|nr:DUF721 domain-containing protein [Phycisphaera sp.]